ncbi:MAG: hypothetical protein AAGN35_12965 [Bacteroidota bacterium]
MIYIHYLLPVNSSADNLWTVLRDKVDNPVKYVSGVSTFRFEAWPDGRVLRVMQRNGITVQEIIAVDPSARSTTFELKDHPQYRGYIKSEVVTREDGTFLGYTLSWEAHSGEEDFDGTHAWFKDAVHATQQLAEAMEPVRA